MPLTERRDLANLAKYKVMLQRGVLRKTVLEVRFSKV